MVDFSLTWLSVEPNKCPSNTSDHRQAEMQLKQTKGRCVQSRAKGSMCTQPKYEWSVADAVSEVNVCVCARACCHPLECWLCLAQRQRRRDWRVQLRLPPARVGLLREASRWGNDPLEGTASVRNLPSGSQLTLWKTAWGWGGTAPIYLFHRYGLQAMDYEAMNPEHSGIDLKIHICWTLGNSFVTKLAKEWNARSLRYTSELNKIHIFTFFNWQFQNFHFSILF